MATPTFGYSGKTLAAKLGIKAGMRVAAIGAPVNYEALLGDIPERATIARFVTKPRSGSTYDIVHLFVKRRSALGPPLAAALKGVAEGGALWISWPKKSSPLFVDLTEDGVREEVLPTGFVDVKVAAVDADWSALKFLRRRRK